MRLKTYTGLESSSLHSRDKRKLWREARLKKRGKDKRYREE